MATYVRQGTGTLPSGTNINLLGTIELDNGTAPPDFDPDGVNSVRIQYRIEIGSGTFTSPEDHTVERQVELTVNGVGTAMASIAGTPIDLDAGSDPVDTDETDSTIATGFTTAQWENAELNPTDQAAVRKWTTYNQDMGKDGVLVQVASTGLVVTVTIDYTPAVASTDLTQLTHRSGAALGPDHGLSRFSFDIADVPQPIPSRLIALATGHELGPLQANLTRFTRPDEVVIPPDPTVTLIEVFETGFEPLLPRPRTTNFVQPESGAPPPPETDLTQLTHRTGFTLEPPPLPTSEIQDRHDVPPQPVPFDLVAKRTGHEVGPDAPNVTRSPFQVVDPPQPVPFDLQAKQTGHDEQPGQPNVTRFERPDFIPPSTNIPFDLVAKHTGHTPAPDKRNVTRFTRPDEQPIPPQTDLTQLVHRTGHELLAPQPPRSSLVGPEFLPDIVPIPPKLTHATGHALRPGQRNESRLVLVEFLPVVAPTPFDLVAPRTGHDAALGQVNETRFVRPDAAPPLGDELWFLFVHQTGAALRPQREIRTLFTLGTVIAGPPTMTLPADVGPNQNEPRVAATGRLNDGAVGSTPAPTRTGATGGRTRVGS